MKHLGVQVGKVEQIDYDGDQAQLTLAIRSDQMGFIPSNSIVKIASNTVFGAKAVEFVPPDEPATTTLSPGAHVQASAVAVNALFQTLVNTFAQDRSHRVKCHAIGNRHRPARTATTSQHSRQPFRRDIVRRRRYRQTGHR